MHKPADNFGSLLAGRLAIILCIGLNVYFYPGISWLLSIHPASAYTQSERQKLIEQYTPTWAINRYLNEHAPGMRVLYPEEASLGATLNGEPVYVMWYSPATLARAQKIQTEADLVAFLQADGSQPGSAKWLLREYLSHAGFPEYKMGDYILYRLLGHNMIYEQVFTQDSVLATETPLELATLQTGAARSARYTAAFNCAANTGYFVAQVNWNTGTSYYRLVPCAESVVNFTEAFPVPAGATEANIYATAWGTTEITVSRLTLEIN
jgi:hypothetical protein